MSTNIIKNYIDTSCNLKGQREVNKYLRESLYEEYLDNVKMEIINLNRNAMFNNEEYFICKIGDMKIVADKMVANFQGNIPQSKIHKYTNWHFKGFCIFEEFTNFDAYYKILDDEFGDYKRINNWKLDLDIIGVIKDGESIINPKTNDYYMSKGVLLTSVGFDNDGRLIKITSLYDDIEGYVTENHDKFLEEYYL